MTNNQSCALCRKSSELVQSHIIPKFITEWIKETSATGFMRQPFNQNLRVQDGIKIPLLCNECENLFSKWEKYFSENIFLPFQKLKDKKLSIPYNENLIKFIISVNWRILILYIDGLESEHPTIGIFAREALEKWRKYLLGESNDKGVYEHHIFFMEYVKDTNTKLHDRFESYIHRSADGTIALNADNDRMFVYTKIPSIIMVSCVYPQHLSGWENTKIEFVGTIKSPQKIMDDEFGGFIDSRLEVSFKEKMSDKQITKFVETVLKNPDRYLKSKSFEVFLEEQKRRLKTNNRL